MADQTPNNHVEPRNPLSGVERYSGMPRTALGAANVRARDRARRRALGQMLRAFRDEHHALVPAGQRGGWRHEASAARIVRDRHPDVWRRVYAEELAKEQLAPLRVKQSDEGQK